MEQDLTLREALAEDRLDDFVRQEEDRGVELANGSDLERALVLLITAPIRSSISMFCISRRQVSRKGRRPKPHAWKKPRAGNAGAFRRFRKLTLLAQLPPATSYQSGSAVGAGGGWTATV
jgi:hypothetical protein